MNTEKRLDCPEFSGLIEQIKSIGKSIIAKHAADVDEQARFPIESIVALKELKLMSAYVPKARGGLGLNVVQIAKICEVLGHYCGSTAMIYAMHKIQVACIVHHCQNQTYFSEYLQLLVEQQRLVASATTEIGIGGDLLSSFCAVEPHNGEFRLVKKAPVISYGRYADDLLVTARKNQDAAKTDQVGVLLNKSQYSLEEISDWDTLGFRGTCSSGFVVQAAAKCEQIMPLPFSEVLSQSMHPFAHIVWAALWSGISADAVNFCRRAVTEAIRRNPDYPPISAIRLAEVDKLLQTMRNGVSAHATEYSQLLATGTQDDFSNFGFSIRTNNLKINASEQLVDIVGKSMQICGIGSYRNNSKNSLCRHIRDAYGASLMVNNDRIMLHNSTLLIMHREN
jgi:acyl-CoA dehydrogenase